MSVGSFKRSFTNPILRKLQQERRKTIERQKGQVILLDNISAFIDVIKETLPGTNISKVQANKALLAGIKKAESLQKTFKTKNRRRYNAIVSKIPEIAAFRNFTLGKNLFIVTSFNYSINQVKKEILNSLETQGIITQGQKSDISKKIHKGHGVVGGAVSEVQVAGSLAGLSKEEVNLLQSNLNSYFKQANVSNIRARQINQLVTSYEQVVTKSGKLKADYFSIISFQVGAENTGVDAQAEKEVKQIWETFVSEYLTPNLMDMRGSSSLKEKLETTILNASTPKSSKNMKVRVTGNTKAKTKTKGKVSKKGPKEPADVSVKSAGILSKSRVKKGISSSPLYLIGVLNQQLPEAVAANMESPRLNYRTGQFASSVRITDIATTAKGFPSIGYTYQKYPYQTFEPGYAQGSVERDPRKLIDKSIRDIAIQFAIGRFYTRRV